MLDIQDYPGPAPKRFEALSYLPQLSDDEIRKQIAYCAEQGWDCVIEHTEPQNANTDYWYMWKLPLFGERDVDAILAEAEACKKAYPGHHVRINANDRYKQVAAFSLVVRRAG